MYDYPEKKKKKRLCNYRVLGKERDCSQSSVITNSCPKDRRFPSINCTLIQGEKNSLVVRRIVRNLTDLIQNKNKCSVNNLVIKKSYNMKISATLSIRTWLPMCPCVETHINGTDSLAKSKHRSAMRTKIFVI